jgi:hypothetical protein
MPPNKLEAVKRKHPKLAEQIDRLAAYLAEQQRAGTTDFLPKLVAVKLGISEAAALGLLMLLEEAGLLSHEYHVLCKATNALIGSARSLSEIEDLYECDFCGKEHSAEQDIKVELVFRPNTSGGNLEHAA